MIFKSNLKHARRFLESGDKVKVTIRFRGREMAHKQLGEVQCNRLVEELGRTLYDRIQTKHGRATTQYDFGAQNPKPNSQNK